MISKTVIKNMIEKKMFTDIRVKRDGSTYICQDIREKKNRYELVMRKDNDKDNGYVIDLYKKDLGE